MKTTVEIADPLLKEARKLAVREGVTLSTLVERGLIHLVHEAERPVSFKLRPVAFKGQGLQAEFYDASWERLSDASNEGIVNPSVPTRR